MEVLSELYHLEEQHQSLAPVMEADTLIRTLAAHVGRTRVMAHFSAMVVSIPD